MTQIIIIDDDTHTLRALQGILESRIDAEIETCASAREGLKKISTTDFDVIVCDIKMPGMDGLTLLTKIREVRPCTPVLMTTAYDESELAVRSIRAGANDFLQKPIDIDYLVAAIIRSISVKHTNRELEEKRQNLERRAAELEKMVEDRAAALRTSHERLELALEAGRMGTWEWDILKQKVTWSATLESMHGLAPGTFGGKFADFERDIHPDDQKIVSKAINDALANRHDYHVQYRFIREPHGQIRWVDSRGKVFYNPMGEPIAMRGICADITQNKLIEEERNKLLAREKEARRQAEDANRAKDDFLATLSHELRSPLTPMLGWARMLLNGNVNREMQLRGLTVIERNVKAQSKLIEDLLDISRIVTGKILVDNQPCDLVRIVDAAIDVVRPSANTKGVRLLLEKCVTSVPMIGDATRLQQVIWNILTNAVKFTPNGGEIKVRIARNLNQVHISITDTGKGIDPQFLPFLFERFSQADSSATRVHGGLGIGLALVKNLVELHGGTVTAHSGGEGKGSTFDVKLPVAEVSVELDTSHPAGNARVKNSVETLPLNAVNILVVDDEQDARELLAMALGHAGAIVTSASTVKEAFMFFQKKRPDVLISDLGMPSEDGFMLIRKIRESETNGSHVPAIALTAYAGDADRIRCLSAGFQIHMPKPVDPFELVNGVTSLIERSSSRQ